MSVSVTGIEGMEVHSSKAFCVYLYLCLFSHLLSVWIGPTLMRGIFLGKSYGKKKKGLIVKACSIIFLSLCVCGVCGMCVCTFYEWSSFLAH